MRDDPYRARFDELRKSWSDAKFSELWMDLKWHRDWLRSQWRIPGMTWDQVEGDLMQALANCIRTYDGSTKTTTYFPRAWHLILAKLLRKSKRKSNLLDGALSLDQQWDHPDHRNMRNDGPLSEFLVVEPLDDSAVETLLERVARLRPHLAPYELRVLDAVLEVSTGDESGSLKHIKRIAEHLGEPWKSIDNAIQRIRTKIKRRRI